MTIHKTPALSRTGWIWFLSPNFCLSIWQLVYRSLHLCLAHSALPHPLQHVCCVHNRHNCFGCFLIFFLFSWEVYTTRCCILTGLPFLSITVSCGRGWRSFRRNCWMMCMQSRWKRCRTWSSVSASSSRPLCRPLSTSSRRERTSYNSSGDND